MCLLGLLLAGGLIWVNPASAKEAAAPAAGFAMVDMERVVAGYEAYQQANDEFRRYYMEVERKLDLNRRMRLLDDKEAQELKDLKAAVVLSSAQRARLQELEGLSDTREQELIAFQQKGALTSEEEARRTVLIGIAERRAPELAAEERRLTEARQKRHEELSSPFNDSIRQALEKAAKKNGISVVFNSDAVLWAAVDLTEGVLAELNQAPKP
jgi:Skp family chaperone for outer membrane proteins